MQGNQIPPDGLGPLHLETLSFEESQNDPIQSDTWQGNLRTRICHHPFLWAISGQLGLYPCLLILWTAATVGNICLDSHFKPSWLRCVDNIMLWRWTDLESCLSSAICWLCVVGRILRWPSVPHILYNLPALYLSMGGTCEYNWLALLWLCDEPSN